MVEVEGVIPHPLDIDDQALGGPHRCSGWTRRLAMVDYSRTCCCCDEGSVAVVEVAPDIELAVCAQHLARHREVEARGRVATVLAR